MVYFAQCQRCGKNHGAMGTKGNTKQEIAQFVLSHADRGYLVGHSVEPVEVRPLCRSTAGPLLSTEDRKDPQTSGGEENNEKGSVNA